MCLPTAIPHADVNAYQHTLGNPVQPGCNVLLCSHHCHPLPLFHSGLAIMGLHYNIHHIQSYSIIGRGKKNLLHVVKNSFMRDWGMPSTRSRRSDFEFKLSLCILYRNFHVTVYKLCIHRRLWCAINITDFKPPAQGRIQICTHRGMCRCGLNWTFFCIPSRHPVYV